MNILPFESNPKILSPSRDGFGKGIVELGETNKSIWVLAADVSESTRTHWFAEKFPERFVQVGVAEQNMAGVAAGIAVCGKIVFASAYGAFSPGRNWDQIRVSVCYNNVNVKFHASHTGLTVGPDGASHQALEDIAITRVLPNMVVVSPCDMEQAKKATRSLAAFYGPGYIRTSREKTPVFTNSETPFELGKANVYVDGSDVAIFAHGVMVWESIKAANELEKEGLSCAVVDCHTIKPIDRKAIVEWARRTGLLVSVEEHQVDGGMGGAIAEVLTSEYPCLLKRHGIYDRFCESANSPELLKKYKLDSAGIAEAVKEAMKMKKREKEQVMINENIS